MKTAAQRISHALAAICGLLCVFVFPDHLRGQPSIAADQTFRQYTASVGSRLASQYASPSLNSLQINGGATDARLKQGQIVLEQLEAPSAPGALLHHWRGTAFAPGASAADFDRLIRDFKSYPQHFAPDVTAANPLTGSGDHWLMRMRVRQRHVITVVLDGTYDVTFSPLGSHRGYTISRSTHIDEIASPNTPNEHPFSLQDQHGFLWRQNTYWSYQERDGGLLLQIESVSLSRDIPHGLGWAVRPYIESIPRESLEFTLRSAVNAIRK